MTIYLIRHGETTWNAEGRWQGSSDAPLNDKGRRQAVSAAEVLKRKGANLSAVYSSDLSRAKDTAGIIAAETGFGGSIAIEPRLREINCGGWEGLTYAVIEEHTMFEEWEAGEIKAPNGGESKREVYERAVKFMEDMAADKWQKRGGDALIVSHSLVIRMLLTYVLRASIGEWDTFAVINAAVTTLWYDGNKRRFKLVALNER